MGFGRRFSTYWCHRGHLSEIAKRLVENRRATLVAIEDADSFFVDLSERVKALQEIDRPHPMSVQVAVSTAKRLLPNDADMIRLTDFFLEEVDRLAEKVGNLEELPNPSPNTEVVSRIETIDAYTEMLVAMMAVGCYWGRPSHETLWQNVIRRLPTSALARNRRDTLNMGIDLYPALLVSYVGGLAAMAGKKFRTLHALFTTPIRDTFHGGDQPVVQFDLGRNFEYATAMRPDRVTPLSDYLFKRLRGPLRSYVPDDTDYMVLFDRYEFFSSATSFHLDSEQRLRRAGRFYCRWLDNPEEPASLKKEFQKEGETWGPVTGGLFEGSVATFSMVFDDLMGEVRSRSMA